MKSIRTIGNLFVVGCVIIVSLAVVFGVLYFTGSLNGILSTEQKDKASTTGVVTTRTTGIFIDCRARTDVAAPVKDEAQHIIHTFFGSFTWNTDTVWMNAQGDVTTCFPADGAVVTTTGNRMTVDVDTTRTVFYRPRVKPAATARSVRYEPGAGRRVAGFVPLFDYFVMKENGSRLTLEAEQFAQSIIGGSRCMKASWKATRRAITTAYHKYAKQHGIARHNVTINFNGSPRFDQHDMKRIPKAFESTKFTVDTKHVVCKSLN